MGICCVALTTQKWRANILGMEYGGIELEFKIEKGPTIEYNGLSNYWNGFLGLQSWGNTGVIDAIYIEQYDILGLSSISPYPRFIVVFMGKVLINNGIYRISYV